jgi:soluble cytochrome b562
LTNNLTLTSQEQIWKTFEETGVLDGWDGEKININGEKSDPDQGGFFGTTVNIKNWTNFGGKTLTLRNCPNLKKIEADCLNLTGLEIENCPRLEHLSAYNNELEELFLDKNYSLKHVNVDDNELKELILAWCYCLEFLSCRNNKLKALDLDDNTELTYLNCSRNEINFLKVTHLNKLKFLYCFFNELEELCCSFLTELKDLNCHANYGIHCLLTLLDIRGCESLEKLDAAENTINSFDLWDLPNLRVASFKENSLSEITIKNTPNLEFLDISRQSIINICEPIPTNLVVRGNSSQNLKKLFYTEGATFRRITSKGKEQEIKKEDVKNIRKIFPKLKRFECSTGETHDFEEYLDELRKKKRAKKLKRAKGNKPNDSGYSSENEEKNRESIITDPTQLTNDYPDLLAEFGNKSEITIAGEDLTGIMIIDGYQGRKINVGNNYLSYLVVKNCPQLTTLRYAHNAMRHDAWYKWNNPKLTTIDNHKYDDYSWNKDLAKLFEEGKLDGKERFNQRAKKKEDEELKEQLLKILLKLLDQAEECANQGDWEKVKQKLVEIHKCRIVFDAEIKERIAKLETRLQSALTCETQSFPYQVIIGFFVIIFLTIGLLVWLANKWVKKILTNKC